MDATSVVAVSALSVIIANTCVVAFWAGKVTQLLKDHGRRLRNLEEV